MDWTSLFIRNPYDLLHFADELQIEDDLTLHELAQHGQLPRVTGRFKLQVESYRFRKIL